MKLELKSKAETLEELKPVIKTANVLPVVRFYAESYQQNKESIFENITKYFDGLVIVRSSSANEDNNVTSNAGGFDSVLNVNSHSLNELDQAISTVIDSYENCSALDEVFVQPMLENVSSSGVVFTADLDTLSPYYIINYDESGSTTSVTSGSSNELTTFIILKDSDEYKTDNIKGIVEAARECEYLYDNQYLDIEFAYVADQLYILQVRAIVTAGKIDLSKLELMDKLRKLDKKIAKLNQQHPNLLGNRTLFGVMPDWNPAEIIGLRPKRLALSLYKELITDNIWAYQRDNYGYRNLRSHPLLVTFLGVPYIDVRISFNSFVPKNLDDGVAEKLVNYYLDQLAKNINHHDKVEFEIIFSCYYFGLEKQINKLKQFGFSDDELKNICQSLLDVTNNTINVTDGLYKQDLKKVESLKQRYDAIVNSGLSLIDKIYWLIEDVKRYGTLPFAGIARAGFIAVQILKSLVTEGILSEYEYDEFLKSLNTVSKNLSGDIDLLSKAEFLKVYGHLRPGTYDITSARYDDAYDTYFAPKKIKEQKIDSFEFTDTQKLSINSLLEKNGVKTNFENLMLFIKEAIEGRESSKFEFTKHLSQVLKYVEQLGGKSGIGIADLAYLDIKTVMGLYSTLDHRDMKEILSSNIEINKDFYQYTKAVKLPSVIVDAKDIYSFYMEKNEANFITQKKVKAHVIKETDISNSNLSGKIVCIKSADPGYDYLFSQDIGGLITCYGGANSHMAIRCAEIGIPAVIGCGENTFARYSSAKVMEIDSTNKVVNILS